MAKDAITVTRVTPGAIKQLHQCVCGATFFQGPFQRGELPINKEMDVREIVYQCLNCNKVQTRDQMIIRDIMPVVL